MSKNISFAGIVFTILLLIGATLFALESYDDNSITGYATSSWTFGQTKSTNTKVYSRDTTYQLTMTLLNRILGDWAYETISDLCESDWNSSTSSSGNTSTTSTDVAAIANATATNTSTNTSNQTNNCNGLTYTTGSVQYSVSDQTNYYQYSYSWTLQACKQDITYQVYMNPGQFSLVSGTLRLGDSPAAATSTFQSSTLYNESCISTNDPSFGTNGIACFNPPSMPSVQQTINFSDECEPIGTTSYNNTYDIYIAGNNYDDINSLSQDILAAASLISGTSPFSQQYNNGNMNFYSVNELFTGSTLVNIRNYAATYCDYTHPTLAFTIILNEDSVECTQSGYIVELNPSFEFNSSISIASLTSVFNDFCSYIEAPDLMNPPTAVILTQSMNTTPSQIPIQFQISDEEYPVGYELLFNNITIVNSSVYDSSIKSHTLSLPSGTWNLQIKAKDRRGNIGYSNIITISTNENITVNFGSLTPLILSSGGSAMINLNNYVTDPRNEPIVEWAHNPVFSSCISFEPSGRILDGNVKLTHISNIRCNQTIIFEAIGSGNRRASGTVVVNAG